MFDGSIENLPVLVAFVLACLLAAPVSAAALFRPGRSVLTPSKGAELAGAGVLVLLWVGLIPLNAWAHLSGQPFEWVFGSETFDGGFVETLTFVGLMFVAWLSVRLALRRETPLAVRVLAVLFAVGLVFVALEEVSYGQHWFHWRATGAFAEANLQHETNLHNFVDPRLYDWLYEIIGGAALVAALLVRVGLMRGLLDRLGPLGETVSRSRYALALTMTASALLLHEVFEELSEFAAVSALVYVAIVSFELWRTRLAPADDASSPGYAPHRA